EEKIASQKKILDTTTPKLAAAQEQWEKSFNVKEKDVAWTILSPFDTSTINGTVLYISDDQSIGAAGNNPDKDTYTVKFKTDLKGITALGREVVGAPGRARKGNFVLTEFRATVAGVADTASDAGTTAPPARRIYLPSGIKFVRGDAREAK